MARRGGGATAGSALSASPGAATHGPGPAGACRAGAGTRASQLESAPVEVVVLKVRPAVSGRRSPCDGRGGGPAGQGDVGVQASRMPGPTGGRRAAGRHGEAAPTGCGTAGRDRRRGLNRPEALNTIVPPMPDEVEAAVTAAMRDPGVKVIVVRGAGRAFCAGSTSAAASTTGTGLTTDGRWDPGKDFMRATAPALAPTQKFMSVWRSPKPVIAQVHGWCVGGGSDFALCADLVIASEDAASAPRTPACGAPTSRDVAVPPRPDQGQGARPHRPRDRGPGRPHRAREPGRAVRRAGGHSSPGAGAGLDPASRSWRA